MLLSGGTSNGRLLSLENYSATRTWKDERGGMIAGGNFHFEMYQAANLWPKDFCHSMPGAENRRLAGRSLVASGRSALLLSSAISQLKSVLL